MELHAGFDVMLLMGNENLKLLLFRMRQVYLFAGTCRAKLADRPQPHTVKGKNSSVSQKPIKALEARKTTWGCTSDETELPL